MDLDMEAQKALDGAEDFAHQTTLCETDEGRAATWNAAIYFMLRAVLMEVSALREDLARRQP